MNPYIEESILITKELGDVTFVGAVAVFLHTKKNRESQDIDFISTKQITRDKFLDLGYRFIKENGREKTYTPRNFKIDVYHSRELNGITLNKIIETRTPIILNKKNTVINTICLEGLIVAKFRAKRVQDLEDLSRFSMYCYKNINWKFLRTFTKNDVEFEEIARTIKMYKDSPLE